MIKIKKICLIILLSFLSIFITCEVSAEKKVLVLHSYHQGLEWTDRISVGIKSIFPYAGETKIYYEYLDAKRNYSSEYLKLLISLYREKAKILKFDAIIVSDNAAFNFIHKYGEELYPQTPVIFCGVNNLNPKLLNSNICGIIEKAEHKSIIQLILKLHPNLHKLIIVNDKTLTGSLLREEIELVLEDYNDKLNYEIWDNYTIGELQKKLTNLDKNNVIYLLALNRDKSGKFISYNQGIKKIKEKAQNPVYAAWDFYLGKGIVGGKLISAERQGREAALLTEKILKGENICTPKILSNFKSRYYFDYQQLKKYNISKKDLPANSLIINKPPPFWQKNYQYLFWILIILALLVVFLLFGIYYKYKEKIKIAKLNKELEEKIKIRTKELKKMSITDDLTKLFNRRHILELLDLELEKAKRYQRSLSIIMLDIDFFKNINDNYGHQVGDQVLTILSGILQSNTRNIDFVGRYGGEEFLIILPEINSEKAFLAADKLRKKIKKTKISDYDLRITVSCGVVEFKNETSNELIKKADDLLYKAKNNGRDRVEN